jgi:hypothetical protein
MLSKIVQYKYQHFDSTRKLATVTLSRVDKDLQMQLHCSSELNSNERTHKIGTLLSVLNHKEAEIYDSIKIFHCN